LIRVTATVRRISNSADWPQRNRRCISPQYDSSYLRGRQGGRRDCGKGQFLDGN